jgi:signal transduction histidine kinase
LAGGVAHDFNNLLTTIIGYSEFIFMEEDLTATTKEGVQEIKNSAERAAALTQQLLAFSRKQVLKPQVIDLIAHHGVLNEGVSLLQKPFSSQSLAGKVREVLDED